MSDLSEPVSRVYTSVKLDLHYLEWGDEGSPPLILMHGGRDHARSWDWVARQLRDDYHIIAPDLRGRGDSEWSPDASYSVVAHTYDLAELIHQLDLAPLPIVAHSFGGIVAMRYAAIYPENVSKMVAIESLGGSSEMMAQLDSMSPHERMRKWIEDTRSIGDRIPRRYATIEQATQRMAEENQHLSREQAHHLTVHGVRRNKDGSYSWKFDNFVRTIWPIDFGPEQRVAMWQRIACPVLLMHGTDSWAGDPEEDGRVEHFQNARVSEFENAGHWLHHDQLDRFVQETRAFLAE
jgi:pimeloyl-ACP methyl ester carboxylesterase